MTTMSLDAYGMGVLAKEISMDMDIETIKAQAVIVRTGIYKKMTEQEEGKELVFTDPFIRWTRWRTNGKARCRKITQG